MRRSPAPSRTPLPPLILGLALLLLLSLVAGTGLGAAGIAGTDVLRFLWAGLTGGTVHAGDAAAYTIVWEIRLPRVVLGAVVGAGLASVGVGVQAIVRNALGDPFVLGISSGAAVGANAVILLGAFAALGIWALSVSAFLSALAAMALVYALARSPHGLSRGRPGRGRGRLVLRLWLRRRTLGAVGHRLLLVSWWMGVPRSVGRT